MNDFLTHKFYLGLDTFKWSNNKHPDNNNFQQKVFWIADWNSDTKKYKVGYHLGDMKSKWVLFGESETLENFKEKILINYL